MIRKRGTGLILSVFILLTACSNAAGPAAAEKTQAALETPAASETSGAPETPGASETQATTETQAAPETQAEEAPQSRDAILPEPVAEGMSAEKFLMSDAHWDWWDEFREKMEASRQQQEGMAQYYESILRELLGTVTKENAVCSPLNIYIALSMLAEVSGGSTQEQILNVLQSKGITELRSRTGALWDANYIDTPAIKSLPANSLWLRNDISYHEEALERLASDYHASSFEGEMGSEELDERLREWTDQNTGGLLKNYTQGMSLDKRTVMALVSTLYYKASWTEKFQEERTDTAVFHGAAGDEDVSMMHRDDMMGFWQTDRFRAVSLGLTDSGPLYFFLPEEGTDVSSIVSDPDFLSICGGKREQESAYPIVHLSVPKFRVSGKTDLLEALKKLGITDALDPDKADFSTLTDAVEMIWVNAAEHAAMVEINEEGVTGAAYTELAMAGAGMPQEEVDFVLDRPFCFAITGRDGSILFAGIIQTIEEPGE